MPISAACTRAMAGMTQPVSGMPTNAALFPQAVDASCKPVRFDFGDFLATGPVGSAFAPFVPGGGSTLQQNMLLSMDRDRSVIAAGCWPGSTASNGSSMLRATWTPWMVSSPKRSTSSSRGAADAFDLSASPPDDRPIRHRSAGRGPRQSTRSWDSSKQLPRQRQVARQASPCWPAGCAKPAADS